MILRNKKTGKFENITREGYERLKEMNMARKFEVLDATDPDISMTNVHIPQEVKDFMANLKDMKLTREEMSEITVNPEAPDPEIQEISEEEPEDAHDDFGTARKKTKKPIKHKK
jgi:hypothetical protein